MTPGRLAELTDDWFRSSQGAAVARAEAGVLRPLLKQLFGYRILQLGVSGNRSLLDDSALYHKIRFAPTWRPGADLAVANAEQLPLAADSVDAVLLYHALDFASDSHRLLREAHRVLRPGGKMLIVGFNPYSSWGLWRLFRRRKGIPWGGRFIGPGRIADWLRLLDLQVDSIRYGLHFFPLRRKPLLRIARSWERLGQKINSPFGGAYIILCVNQVRPVTPIMKRWLPLPARPGAIVAQVSCHASYGASERRQRVSALPRTKGRTLMRHRMHHTTLVGRSARRDRS